MKQLIGLFGTETSDEEIAAALAEAAEVTKHAQGAHDQKSHGNWARGNTVEVNIRAKGFDRPSGLKSGRARVIQGPRFVDNRDKFRSRYEVLVEWLDVDESTRRVEVAGTFDDNGNYVPKFEEVPNFSGDRRQWVDERLIRNVAKHASHDQSTHGNWAGGSSGGNNAAPSRAPARITSDDFGEGGFFGSWGAEFEGMSWEIETHATVPRVYAPHLTRCYEISAHLALALDGGGHYEPTLVHGIIRDHGNDSASVAHGWVEIDHPTHGTVVYEPGSNTIYLLDDFKRMFSPIIFEKYSVEDARTTMIQNRNWGPWDDASDAWYEAYEQGGNAHATRSTKDRGDRY